jgi:hypothetical protein
MVVFSDSPATKLWITAQKLWINRADCGKVAQLFGLRPPYMAQGFPTLQNLDGVKMDNGRSASTSKFRRFSPKVLHRLWILLSAK